MCKMKGDFSKNEWDLWVLSEGVFQACGNL